MVELRPLIVVTGTLHVEGGFKRARTKPAGATGAAKQTITEDVRVTSDRRAGNVVAARYLRKLRDLKLLHTPYGILVDPAHLDKVKDTISQSVVDRGEFNRTHKSCQVDSTLVWEHLRGNRLDAVTAWVERRAREGDEKVISAYKQIVTVQAA